MGSSHKVDIGGLLGGGRQHLLVDQQVALEPFEGVTFPQPANVHLTVRAAEGAIEITGSIEVEAHGECDRCLDEVVANLRIGVDEQLAPEEDAKHDPFGENNVLTGTRLDVADLTSQLVYSAVPLGWICQNECAGLCTNCGENKNTGACTCATLNEV